MRSDREKEESRVGSGVKRRRRPATPWVIALLAFVLVIPMVTFLVNRRLSTPNMPATDAQGTSDAEPYRFGHPYEWETLLTLTVGDRTEQIAPPGSPGAQGPPLTLESVSRDPAGRIWVVDHPAEDAPRARVRALDPSGAVLAEFTTAPGATLFTPGLSDDLWVDLPPMEGGSERFQRYSLQGEVLAEYPLPVDFQARHIRFDPDGRVYAYQEQWLLDSESQRTQYSGTLLPVATGGAYEPIPDVEPFPGIFFGADENLYVAEASFRASEGEIERFTLHSVARDGSTVAEYSLPERAVPIGADAEGRVCAELAPEQIVEARSVAALGDVDRENSEILMYTPEGLHARLLVARPPFVGGWAPSLWLGTDASLTATRWSERGIDVVSIRPASTPTTTPPNELTADTENAALQILCAEEPLSADPYQARDSFERDLMQLLHAGLVRLDANLEPVPVLAREIPTRANGGVSDDGLRITYRIRDGILWHDGSPVTAEDVVATFEYLRTGSLSARPDPFPGFKEIRAVRAEGSEVIVDLRRPFGAGPEAFFPYVLPGRLVGEASKLANAECWSLTLGCGPYRLVEWLQDDRWILEAAGNSPDGKASIERIDVLFRQGDDALAAFQSTDVPALWTWVLPQQVEAVTRDAVGEVVEAETGRWRGVLLGSETDELAETSARKALVLAYPRARLSQEVLPSSTATLPVDTFPSVTKAHNSQLPVASGEETAAARSLLAQVGWQESSRGDLAKKGEPFRVQLHIGRRFGSDEASFEYATIVLDAWEAIGLVAGRDFSRGTMYDSWYRGGFLATRPYSAAYGVYPGFPDPGWGGVFDRNSQPSAANPRGVGVAAGEDSILNNLYAAARREYDRDRRASIGRQIGERVRDEALCVYERYETRNVAVIGDVIGFDPGPYPAGDFWNVESWELD